MAHGFKHHTGTASEMRADRSRRRQRVGTLFAVGSFLAALPAAADDLRVEITDCPTSKGMIAIEASDANWDEFKVGDPSQFVRSMIGESKCFTPVSPGQGADYALVFGTLTKAQYNAGADAFSGRSGGLVETPALGADAELTDTLGALMGSNKMRYAWMEVRNRSGGVLARGFGRNNRSKIDMSHWQYDPSAVATFAHNKKSRRMSGALVNAFAEVQDQVMGGSFGTVMAKTAAYSGGGGASGGAAGSGVFIGDIMKERSENSSRYKRKYATAQRMTLNGYVTSMEDGRVPYLTIASSTMLSGTTSGAECGGISEAEALSVNRGDPITITGSFKAGTTNLMTRLFANDCSIVGPWDPAQRGGGGAAFSGSHQPLGTVLRQIESNSFGFYRKNEGKPIGLSGPVSTVSQADNGVVRLSLRDDTMSGFAARAACELLGSEVDKAVDLMGGDIVRVSGRVKKGLIRDELILEDCRIN